MAGVWPEWGQMGPVEQAAVVDGENDVHGWRATGATVYLCRAWRVDGKLGAAQHGVRCGTLPDGRWYVRAWCGMEGCEAPVTLIRTSASSLVGTPVDAQGEPVYEAFGYRAWAPLEHARVVRYGPSQPCYWTYVHDEVELLCWPAWVEARAVQGIERYAWLRRQLTEAWLRACRDAHTWLQPERGRPEAGKNASGSPDMVEFDSVRAPRVEGVLTGPEARVERVLRALENRAAREDLWWGR